MIRRPGPNLGRIGFALMCGSTLALSAPAAAAPDVAAAPDIAMVKVSVAGPHQVGAADTVTAELPCANGSHVRIIFYDNDTQIGEPIAVPICHNSRIAVRATWIPKCAGFRSIFAKEWYLGRPIAWGVTVIPVLGDDGPT